MSALNAPTPVGVEPLSAQAVRASVLREMLDFDASSVPTEDSRRRAMVLGWLSERVAQFLNDHPEHRDELLPDVDPDSAGGSW